MGFQFSNLEWSPNFRIKVIIPLLMMFDANQSGAAEAWWAHNPQVRGSKPRFDNTKYKLPYEIVLVSPS